VQPLTKEWEQATLDQFRKRGEKYVCPFRWLMNTRYGEVCIPRTMTSDGSSGPALDRCPPAWWAHDRLYVSPWVRSGDRLRMLTRMQCDLVYSLILTRHYMPLDAAVSLVGLTVGGWRAWRRSVKLREELGELESLNMHILPHPDRWLIESFDLARARLAFHDISLDTLAGV
jgi:hypothetical protein